MLWTFNSQRELKCTIILVIESFRLTNTILHTKSHETNIIVSFSLLRASYSMLLVVFRVFCLVLSEPW